MQKINIEIIFQKIESESESLNCVNLDFIKEHFETSLFEISNYLQIFDWKIIIMSTVHNSIIDSRYIGFWLKNESNRIIDKLKYNDLSDNDFIFNLSDFLKNPEKTLTLILLKIQNSKPTLNIVSDLKSDKYWSHRNDTILNFEKKFCIQLKSLELILEPYIKIEYPTLSLVLYISDISYWECFLMFSNKNKTSSIVNMNDLSHKTLLKAIVESEIIDTCMNKKNIDALFENDNLNEIMEALRLLSY